MTRLVSAALCAILTLGAVHAARAQPDTSKRPWSNSADLSLVVTGGNSETVNVSRGR